jgi:hypothetical protein
LYWKWWGEGAFTSRGQWRGGKWKARASIFLDEHESEVLTEEEEGRSLGVTLEGAGFW